MAKKEVYCQNSDCGRKVDSGVIVNSSLYCCFGHGGVEDNSQPFYDSKKVQKAIRRGELTKYGLLEESVSE
jgi:hypothetical protein